MRATIRNYTAAVKARRQENGEDEGFSLIELIVVVVILGILAAIAVPVFTGLQQNAEKESVRTIAANGATQVAADIAKSTATPTLAELNTSVDKLEQEGITLAVTLAGGATTPAIDNFIVTAKKGETLLQSSGPGYDGTNPAPIPAPEATK